MKTIRDYNLENKKVIIRVDFNVPIKDGVITDDNRIRQSIETIKYAIDHNAKVILMSHLGRVKEKEDIQKYSLLPVAQVLADYLNKTVKFVKYTKGKTLENSINKMEPGDVLLMENTRFEDLIGKRESGNDKELGEYWASLGDIFINDAFATSHRAHASNVGIASHLPNGVGFLVERELNNMVPVINNPEKPFTVILGGAKVSDKIGVIENLIDKADYILIGGGMAYTFLKALGKEVGKSLIEDDRLDYCKELLKNDKIIIPVDHIASKEIGARATTKKDLSKDDIGLDIGPETIHLFTKYIKKSKTIIWNGPVGMFEYPKYANGTIMLCEAIKNQITIVGGGDTASAIINLGFKDKMTHVSTGGGASLELLEGKDLPGIKIINK